MCVCKTCVHGQDFVVAEQRGDELLVFSQHVVVEGSGGQRESGGLLVQRCHDFWVAVTLIYRAVRTQEVKIPTAFDVPHVNS